MQTTRDRPPRFFGSRKPMMDEFEVRAKAAAYLAREGRPDLAREALAVSGVDGQLMALDHAISELGHGLRKALVSMQALNAASRR